MTLNDIKKINVYQTRTIASACQDEKTLAYVLNCLQKFYAGDYGEVDQEDTDANNADLESGYGHILARYNGAFNLNGSFYIEAHFDKDHLQDVDFTQIMIMYPEER